jgi:hypothetical protein
VNISWVQLVYNLSDCSAGYLKWGSEFSYYLNSTDLNLSIQISLCLLYIFRSSDVWCTYIYVISSW